MLALLVLAFLLDVALGSIHIPLKAVIGILISPETADTTWLYIIQQIRLPKALTAIVVGCGLSVSGLQMQTLFRNPLAGPSVLGITAGASLGVALVMLSAGTITSLYSIKELGNLRKLADYPCIVNWCSDGYVTGRDHIFVVKRQCDCPDRRRDDRKYYFFNH